ncbi:MAG: sigma-54 dependent transcriptional regulator [Phycisphaerae bacterium]|jgi:DNA-binding NtrC family response regulator
MMEQVVQNVLVVSNERATVRQVQEVLAAKGLRGVVVASASAAAPRLDSVQWEMILCDGEPLDRDVLELLAKARSCFPERPAILLGAQGDTAAAVAAIREGCRDFLAKPVTAQSLQACLDLHLPNHRVPMAAVAQEDSRCLYQIAGRSGRLLETISLAQKLSPTSMPILISGESGTGKELLAYLIHRTSARRGGPYVRVNCAALSESLLESELFGHERGAFTGAYTQRKGRFELAHGGTLLLDEISETSIRLQAQLLRVLEQQDFERVGGSESVRVNVRVVSTTNRNLAAEVEAGRFRRDLYYRLCGAQLNLPPLRERTDDIPALIWHFVNSYAAETQRRITSMDAQMLDAFCRYPWPGNVRQLRNVVRSALALGAGPVLSLEGAAGIREELLKSYAAPAKATLQLQELERRTILEALERTQRNQVKAARLLGITDRTLREKLRRYREDGHLETVGDSVC